MYYWKAFHTLLEKQIIFSWISLHLIDIVLGLYWLFKAVHSHRPTKVVSHRPTEVVLQRPTKVVSHRLTKVVSHRPTKIVSHRPTKVVLQRPTKVVPHRPTKVRYLSLLNCYLSLYWHIHFLCLVSVIRFGIEFGTFECQAMSITVNIYQYSWIGKNCRKFWLFLQSQSSLAPRNKISICHSPGPRSSIWISVSN